MFGGDVVNGVFPRILVLVSLLAAATTAPGAAAQDSASKVVYNGPRREARMKKALTAF